MSGCRLLPGQDWPKCQLVLVEQRKVSSILGNWEVAGYPPSPWSGGIIDLAENFEVIYGAQ
jgi:hypothetical protein